ncbi:transposase [Streptomyces sp. NPDC050997]|uniref:transposase n=1 Tax=Streptomyces sp. NPDC050997 TaxID=3155519 RepID=UPI00342EE8C1
MRTRAARQPQTRRRHDVAAHLGLLSERGAVAGVVKASVDLGQVSRGWHGPYPTSSPTAAPLIVARFTKSQCRPRGLRDLQLRVRAEQQTPDWKTRYAVRSGVEGTINEFAHGHGMRHCRYRGQPKAHLQHVLTAIAVGLERLSG